MGADATEGERSKGELWIEYVRLDGIHRDPTNPKDHDLGGLAESLKRFGFVAPMGMNEETGLLLFGHGRLDELEDLRRRGEPAPDNVKVDPGDGMWLAPVVRGVNLSEDDGKAYVIADNRLVELGGWNEPELARRLIEIAGGEAGLEATGFDGQDVDALLDAFAGPGEFPPHSDTDPETESEAAAARSLRCPECGAAFRLADAVDVRGPGGPDA
jgi:hypothetical protein